MNVEAARVRNYIKRAIVAASEGDEVIPQVEKRPVQELQRP
jgi:hypothetical protein